MFILGLKESPWLKALEYFLGAEEAFQVFPVTKIVPLGTKMSEGSSHASFLHHRGVPRVEFRLSGLVVSAFIVWGESSLRPLILHFESGSHISEVDVDLRLQVFATLSDLEKDSFGRVVRMLCFYPLLASSHRSLRAMG